MFCTIGTVEAPMHLMCITKNSGEVELPGSLNEVAKRIVTVFSTFSIKRNNDVGLLLDFSASKF